MAEVRVRKNIVMRVKSLSEASDKGSYGAVFRLLRPTLKDPPRGLTVMVGLEIERTVDHGILVIRKCHILPN